MAFESGQEKQKLDALFSISEDGNAAIIQGFDKTLADYPCPKR